MHKYGTGDIIGSVTADEEENVPQGLSVTARQEMAREVSTRLDAVELAQENREA